ncbi:copper amine oxidase-like protein [Paenibacillus cellulosilyticus]|uniref:Copper amine oxidase-like protein n=2 Tax=Paenibacillus cellulosilyticus TaxID=375489 RepID=A0A2V2YTD9_9BACL|nr:copper amine oxidase-like protein [Paenibacillus cellulosilyticus]
MAVILSVSMLLPVGAHMTYAASKYVVLEAQWEDGHIDHVQTLLKDGVTYGSFFSLGSEASLHWSMEDKDTAVLSGSKKRIVVYMGSSIAEVDGQKVDMGRAPVWYISHLYVPIKFLAAALDGEVTGWDPKSGKVTITGLHNYNDTFSRSLWGYTYRIQSEVGDLEITNVKTGKLVTIPLGIKDIDVNTHNLTFDFEVTSKNLLIASILYSDRKTGVYDLYTLVFKNQGLIRKSIAHGLTEQIESIRSDGNIQLINDENIRVIEDGTGHVLEVNAR